MSWVKMPCLVFNAGIWKAQKSDDIQQLGKLWQRSGLPRENPRVAKVRGSFLVILGANPARLEEGQAN